jgi:hypothetical protein
MKNVLTYYNAGAVPSCKVKSRLEKFAILYQARAQRNYIIFGAIRQARQFALYWEKCRRTLKFYCESRSLTLASFFAYMVRDRMPLASKKIASIFCSIVRPKTKGRPEKAPTRRGIDSKKLYFGRKPFGHFFIPKFWIHSLPKTAFKSENFALNLRFYGTSTSWKLCNMYELVFAHLDFYP